MEEKSQILNGKNVNDILPINKATEEEFANFMHRVTQVGKLRIKMRKKIVIKRVLFDLKKV